jgi:hypothetical protein
LERKLQETRSFELHHDNAPAHIALSVRKFLAKKCIPVLSQAPDSPCLSPCDFYLFPKLKSRIKGYHFQTFDSVQEAVTDAFKILTEADLQSCYEAPKIRCAKCISSEGCYFKGDNADFDEYLNK